MKKLFKHLIPFLTALIIVVSASAVTTQGGSPKMQGSGVSGIQGGAGTELIDEDFTPDPSWAVVGTSSVIGGQLVSTVNPTDYSYLNFTAQTDAWISFEQTISSVSLANSNIFEGSGFSTNAADRRVFVAIKNDGGTIKHYVRYADDTTTAEIVIGQAVIAFVDGDKYDITIHWKAATAPAANDGVLQVWINTTLVLDITNADSDTLDVSRVVQGSFSGSDVGDSATFTNDNVRVGTTGEAPF